MRRTVEEVLQRWISRGRRSARDPFPERVYISEHQIFRFAKMILPERCNTSYDLALLFVAGAVLETDGMDKNERNLAELLCF